MNIPPWYVITGAPNSGKSTLIEIFKEKGFVTVEEAARTYIDSEIKSGKTLEQIRKNELTFQRKILEMKLTIEQSISKDKIVFFDRGIPDSMAYYILCGIYYDKFLARSLQRASYKKVFLLEPLEWKVDYARTENSETQEKLHKLLETSYSRLGMTVVHVPVLPNEDRVGFIMSNLG